MQAGVVQEDLWEAWLLGIDLELLNWEREFRTRLRAEQGESLSRADRRGG